MKASPSPRSRSPLPERLKLQTTQQTAQNYQWQERVQFIFFQKIAGKITSIQSLTKQGQNQRCLQHNIPVSLYCTQCRKIMCASCMYTFNTHKRHKVVPLENAVKQIREDIETMQSKLDNKIKICQNLADDANLRIMETTRSFERALFQIGRFYDDLFDMLKRKREDQLKSIQKMQSDMNNELKTYFRTLSQVNVFMAQKLGTYGNSNVKFELLLPSKSILQVMNDNISSTSWLQVDFDRHKYSLDTTKFKDIINELSFKIDFINKRPIANGIKKMQLKQSSKKTPSRILTPRHCHAKDKLKSSLSLVASPRSVKRW